MATKRRNAAEGKETLKREYSTPATGASGNERCPIKSFDSRRYEINQKTLAKCKKSLSVADLPTGPKEPHSTVPSFEEEAILSRSAGIAPASPVVEHAEIDDGWYFLTCAL